MNIVTYQSQNAPDGFQWVAKWQVTKIVKNKNPEFDETHTRDGFLPIWFHDQSEQGAIDKAQAWWATGEENRVAKLEARKEAAEKRARKEGGK
ncbi:hypothetical protein [Maritalea porphyrae]|uniref:hypothetical protein n=1 Tax=Maritalea porphyrae TaxID=880732 RepID=UPI0022AF89BF|nr:hypothetical protein [Maritalea porphyrae]MCZ4270928.1 hypothetical protein [Maritalea porphyrae]